MPPGAEPNPASCGPRLRVIDIGCGTGPASLLLAAEAGADVVAVDNHPPFLAQLREDAEATGLAARIRTLAASMEDLPLPDGCADLVWAEGSAYVMGVDAALRAWQRLLAPGGVLVLTDAAWTTDTPAAAARAFWEPGYPTMRTTAATVAAATAAGWTVVATYLLPESDWTKYYGPLAARIAQLRADRPEAAAALDEVGREIDIRRDHGTDYGYVGYVLRRTRHIADRK